jgi:hypothetical protein
MKHLFDTELKVQEARGMHDGPGSSWRRVRDDEVHDFDERAGVMDARRHIGWDRLNRMRQHAQWRGRLRAAREERFRMRRTEVQGGAPCTVVQESEAKIGRLGSCSWVLLL